MVGCKFNKAGSPDGTSARVDAEMGDQAKAKSDPKGVKESFSDSQQAPVAHDGVKEKPGITFAHQGELPKLPIPELKDSLEKYKYALEPLQTRREQQDTAAAVDEFLKSEGPDLQSRLKKYASSKTSYIEQFCKLSKPTRIMLYLM